SGRNPSPERRRLATVERLHREPAPRRGDGCSPAPAATWSAAERGRHRGARARERAGRLPPAGRRGRDRACRRPPRERSHPDWRGWRRIHGAETAAPQRASAAPQRALRVARRGGRRGPPSGTGEWRAVLWPGYRGGVDARRAPDGGIIQNSRGKIIFLTTLLRHTNDNWNLCSFFFFFHRFNKTCLRIFG